MDDGGPPINIIEFSKICLKDKIYGLYGFIYFFFLFMDFLILQNFFF